MKEIRIKGCMGDCHQGRLPCPTPQACELPEDNDVDPLSFSWLLVAVALVGIAVLVGNVLFALAGWANI